VTPPKFDLVIQDCDAALALDPKYVKALNRRATAFEGLLRWQEALRGTFCVHLVIRTWTNPTVKFADFTAATILDRFQNQTTANAVERVLKMLSAEKAKDLLSVSFFPKSFRFLFKRILIWYFFPPRNENRDCPRSHLSQHTSPRLDHVSHSPHKQCNDTLTSSLCAQVPTLLSPKIPALAMKHCYSASKRWMPQITPTP